MNINSETHFITENIGDFYITYDPLTDIGTRLNKTKEFEKEEIEIASRYIKNDSIILDIGANIGLHSLRFSYMAKEGLVFAFEPQPRTFAILVNNIFQNNLKNVFPLNIAIAETPEISDFFVMSDNAYSSLIDTKRKQLLEQIRVLCVSIDKLFDNIKIDFVKIDVEGTELDVLYSMKKIISHYKPIIFCEVYKGKIDFYNPHDTIEYIQNNGYRAFRVMHGNLFEFKKNDVHNDKYYNYFFIPLEHNSCA